MSAGKGDKVRPHNKRRYDEGYVKAFRMVPVCARCHKPLITIDNIPNREPYLNCPDSGCDGHDFS